MADETSLAQLKEHPWAQVEGVLNIRDLGGYPSEAFPGKVVRKGVLFRSGEPSRVTDAGKESMKQLRIKRIYDLRQIEEKKLFNSPGALIDGVRSINVPGSRVFNWDEESRAVWLKKFAENPLEAFLKEYQDMLEDFAGSYAMVLRDVIDSPNEAAIVHCTAGKDRTGIFAAIVLQLLGVSNETIAYEYNLTEVGLLPAIPMLAARMKADNVFGANPEGTKNVGSCKKETMLALLEILDQKYGGSEGYLRSKANFTDVDITAIRDILLVEA